MKNFFGKSLDFDWLTNKISCAFYAHLSAWQKLGPERVGVNRWQVGAICLASTILGSILDNLLGTPTETLVISGPYMHHFFFGILASVPFLIFRP